MNYKIIAGGEALFPISDLTQEATLAKNSLLWVFFFFSIFDPKYCIHIWFPMSHKLIPTSIMYF